MSDVGRPPCLIPKSPRKNQKFHRADTNPHEIVKEKYEELLNLDQDTEQETHKNYYDMDIDSFHLR